MTVIDPHQLAGTKPKGRRPRYFDDHAVDRVLNITTAVAMELAVVRERLDTLERLLESKNLLDQADIEGFTPTAEQARQRADWTQEYLARIFRFVQQELEEISENDNPDIETVIEEMRSNPA